MRALALVLALAMTAPVWAAKPKPKSKPKASAKPAGERPFASAGYLDVPEGRDVRMGDPSGGLAIVAQGGSLIKRQNKALVLDRGKMAVSMKGDGKNAVRVGAGTLIVETAGAKFVLERADTTKLSVLEGKVLVNGAGAPRNLSGFQQLEVSAGGKVKVGSVPSAQRNEAMRWIESK